MSGLLGDDDSNPMDGLDNTQPPPHNGYAWEQDAQEEPQQPQGYYEPAYQGYQPQYAPQAPQGYQQPQWQQEPPPAYVPPAPRPMSEAQKRLNKAMLYQQVIDMSVFGSDDPMALEVENEFKEWAVQKMNSLLGVGEEPSLGAISAVEIRILKAFATSILQNAKLRSSLGITDGQGPPPARPRPAVPPPPVVRPQVRPRPQPVGGQPQQPRPALVQPQYQQPQPQWQQPPVRRPPPQYQQPQPQWRQPPPQYQQRPPQGYGPPQQQVKRPQTVESMPQDGDVIKEKGRTYKVAWVEMHPGEFGPSSEKRLDRMPPHSVGTERGIPIIKTEGEEYFKVVKRDMTPQVRGTGGAPAITDSSQMAAVTAMRSNQALQSLHPSISGLAGRLASE